VVGLDHTVVHVGSRQGLGEGVLYFWFCNCTPVTGDAFDTRSRLFTEEEWAVIEP